MEKKEKSIKKIKEKNILKKPGRKYKQVDELYAVLSRLNNSRDIIETFRQAGPVLLLEKEIYYKEKIISILKNAYPETEVYFGDELDIDKIDNAFSQAGLFSSHKFVLFRQAHTVNSKKKNIIGALQNRLSSEQACDVLMISQERKIDKAIQSVIDKSGNVITCWGLFDDRARMWISKKAASLGMQIDLTVSEEIRFRTGNDLSTLEDVLVMLQSNYISDQEQLEEGHKKKIEVNADQIKKTLLNSNQISVFEFIDSAMLARFDICIKQLHSLISSGVNKQMIIAMLIKEFILVSQACELAKQGQNWNEIVAALKINYLQQRKFQEKIRLYKDVNMSFFREKILKIDLEGKTLNQDLTVPELENLLWLLYKKRLPKINKSRR